MDLFFNKVFVVGNNKTTATASDVTVTIGDFKFSMKSIKPSISEKDLEYFNKLKSDFK